MKKILFTCLAMLICCGSIASDNLIISNVTIPQNGDAAVNVDFHFDKSDGYAGFGFELIVPAGISIVKGTDGNNLITLSETACSGMLPGITSEPKFGAYTMNNSIWIKGTEGTLMTFYLHADSEIEVGTQLTVTVNNAYLSPRPTQDNPMPESVQLTNFTFNITIGAPADSRVTFDENLNNADVLKAATGIDVRVKRTIKANEWSTLCLPFAMTAAQVTEAFGNDVQLAEFTGAVVDDETEDITVNFANVTAIAANVPYIIKVSEGITEFTADGVDINPVSAPRVDKDKDKRTYNSFIGTYVAETVVPEYGLFLSDNQFWFSTGNTKMKAFRAYFDLATAGAVYDDAELAARVFMSFDESETTGISGVKHESNDDRYYNLNGQRVEHVKKGLYIKNNRKVVVK